MTNESESIKRQMQDPDKQKSSWIVGHQMLQGLYFCPIPHDKFLTRDGRPLEDRQLWERGDWSQEGYGKDWIWRSLAGCYEFEDRAIANLFAEKFGGTSVRILHDREEAVMDLVLARPKNWYDDQWRELVHG